MAGVLLILGLVAAGVYTGAWGFYVAAFVCGGTYMMFMAAMAAIIKAGVNEIKKSGGSVNLRNRKF